MPREQLLIILGLVVAFFALAVGASISGATMYVGSLALVFGFLTLGMPQIFPRDED